MKKLSHELGVDDRVTFVGALSSEDTLALMRGSDVFLATSNRKEGWGATVNEAMAAGCAVVASNQIGSAPFLIDSGVDGVIFRSEDARELADAVAASDSAAALRLCGDNGAMIGAQGYYEYLAGHTAGMELNAYATRDIADQ